MTQGSLHESPSRLAEKGLLLFVALLMLVALGIFTATRIVLALYTGMDSVPLSGWPRFLFFGLWFDVATLCYLLVPFLLYEAAFGNRWRPSGWQRWVRYGVFWFVTAALLFNALAELLFWIEFETRFNFIAVDYLVYTREVIGNIRESYPVSLLLLAVAGLAALLTWALRGPLARAFGVRLARGARRRLLLAAVLLPFASGLLANVDQMYGHGNNYVEELSGNGLFTFMAAFRRNVLDYERWYVTMPQDKADRILHDLGVERVPLSVLLKKRHTVPEALEPTPDFLLRRPRHIVLITVESLSAEYLGSYGSKQGLTPRLDDLARQGVQFDRVLATGTRTVRGLEALSLGTPPVPGQAIVRRPHNEHLTTIGEMLEHLGFTTSFVYGGYGYFDNMNAYFAGNDYITHDRTDFPKESVIFENVWGVADEVLFNNALPLLDKTGSNGKRFFMHIMTTSNHRPYTYPDGRIDIPSPGGREGGVKYTDYAIGQFIAQARRHPWFDDTLFVIIADHCASVSGKTELPVAKYHIPLILYGPKIVKPSRFSRMVSQIDVPPTLFAMLGVEGDDHYFGNPVHEQTLTGERAFISNYQSLGYYKHDILTVLKPKRKIESYRIDPKTFEATPAPISETLRDEAIAYYQTASLAFKRDKLKAPGY
ncbi:MAG: LTA synthase family protein [Sulfuricaulis sp.]|uniref:LTA synthase family protein n=1 Tax=Sulfuricaulis sp. TaxID=2003553 RepID=UPI0025FC00E0|nr:LTA synthase family protein [Sulfuricaulis sp.]MCR4346192.1 LTA synthase family protein [Sulfuricaulis sp.]